MNRANIAAAAVLGLAALAGGCKREQDTSPPTPRADNTVTPSGPADTAAPPPGSAPDAGGGGGSPAIALLRPASGSQVRGTVRFTETDDGMRVVADVSGLTPGKHGFHVHQNGDCSAPDAMSAGDHFNPDAQQHGGPDTDMRHRGDLGNIEANAEGRAQAERTVKGLVLSGPESIAGKAVLVHAGEDDLRTPPSGNSGARVACGVIETAS